MKFNLNMKLLLPAKHQIVSLGFTLALACAAQPAQADGPIPPHLDAAVGLLDQITSLQAIGVFTDNNGVKLNRYGGSWNSVCCFGKRA